jgi:glycosyltransferase involved in cell wall biosynthesis
MQFILYSDIGEGSIRERLGRPEYSYFFVLSGFRTALSELGDVVLVQHPESEVDALYDSCLERGEPCVFLSFTPPHKTLIDLRCPTVVVLAWEYDTIPTGGWDDEQRNDWRFVFAKLGRAICLSSYSARAVKAAMGEAFPAVAIATPVAAPTGARSPAPPEGVELRLRGTIIDSPKWGFRCDMLLPPLRPPQIDPEEEEDDEESAELLDTDAVPFHAGLSALSAPVAIDSDPFQPSPDQLASALHIPASALLAPAAIDADPDQPSPDLLASSLHARVSALLAPVAVDADPFQPSPDLLASSLQVPASALLAPSAIDARPVPPPATPNLRARLGITKRHLIDWYRETIRDLLPLSIRLGISRLGRGAERLYRRAAGIVPPQPVPSTPDPVDGTPPALPAAPAPAAPPPTRMPTPREPHPVGEAPVPVTASIEAGQCPPAETVRPEAPEPAPEVRVQVSGIVYTALFNPTDGRKNWLDLLTAFVYTFREVEDATLVMKIIHYDPKSYYDKLFVSLSQLAPFKCRVISLYGYLETAEYEKLISVTDFYVSAARAEGLCLPLMEFMACAKPAVTPLHTAMEDYVDADSAFIVRSTLEHNVWPQDPRALYTTAYYQVQWQSLCDQLAESYRVATTMPEQYRGMARRGAERVRAFASVETVREQLREFFGLGEAGTGVAEPERAERRTMEPAAS